MSQNSYGKLFINNKWVDGEADIFESLNPATYETVWKGHAASQNQIEEALSFSRKAFSSWKTLNFEARLDILKRFQNELELNKAFLSELISKETGKTLWESHQEVGSMIQKLPISVEAQKERCQEKRSETASGISIRRYKPHGVVAVFGPFNFPGHLPNGHILPALLAGNTVILKPSELTPAVSEFIIHCFEKAGIPSAVIQLIQGGPLVGKTLSSHKELDGLFFTGSYPTGLRLNELFAKSPEKILALEMGGNNPLIVQKVSNLEAAVYHSIMSAFVTSGQRCSCARRLIVIRNSQNQTFVEELVKASQKLLVGPYFGKPEPFMGPIVSKEHAERILAEYHKLVTKGAKVLLPMRTLFDKSTFLSPSILDVTEVKDREDGEIFGPLLQLIWVNDFEEALTEAKHTDYGLVAGLFSDQEEYYHRFLEEIRAGVINWNRPTTGALGNAPFGGVGKSGNHRPSAYFAVDYCVYPVASLEEKSLNLPANLVPGISL